MVHGSIVVQDSFNLIDPKKYGCQLVDVRSGEITLALQPEIFGGHALGTIPKAKTFLGCNFVALRLQCMAARRAYNLSGDKEMIDEYIRLVRLGVIPATGKTWKKEDYNEAHGLANGKWKYWWNLLHPEMVLKYGGPAGDWSMDDGHHNGLNPRIDNSWESKLVGSEEDPYDFRKRFKQTTSKKLLQFRGDCWIADPVLKEPVEKQVKKMIDEKDEKGLQKITLSSRHLYYHGPGPSKHLTCYFMTHQDHGYVYPEFVYEDYYGQLYKDSGDWRFKHYKAIGEVMQIPKFKVPEEDLLGNLEKHWTKPLEMTESKVWDSYKKYYNEASWIQINCLID